MPPAAAIVGGVFSAVGTIAGGIFGAISGLGILGKVAMFAASMLFKKSPSVPNLSAQTIARQFKITTNDPTAQYHVVYGSTRKSGNIFWVETDRGDKDLYLCILLACHELTNISHMYFDKTLAWVSNGAEAWGSGAAQGRFDGYLWAEARFGGTTNLTENEIANDSPSWQSSSLGKGRAWVAMRLASDIDAYPNGKPANIEFDIQGKQCMIYPAAVPAFTSNPAWILLDYLTSVEYGYAVPLSQIDIASFTTAAGICDQSVTLAAGGTEARYTFNGVVSKDQSHESIVNTILESMAGELYENNGQYVLKAGAYTAPVTTIADDDVVGDVSIAWSVPRRERLTSIEGLFIDPANNYEPLGYGQYQSSSLVTKYGESLPYTLDFPYTHSAITAQRLAKIHLLSSQKPITVDLTVSYKFLDVTVGDVIQLTLEEANFTNKTFKVLQMGISDNGIRMSLKEFSSDIFDWDHTAEEQEVADILTPLLPDNFTVENPSGLSLTPTGSLISNDGTFTHVLYDVRFNSAEQLTTSSVVLETAIETAIGSDTYAKFETASSTKFWVSANIALGQGNPQQFSDQWDGVDYDDGTDQYIIRNVKVPVEPGKKAKVTLKYINRFGLVSSVPAVATHTIVDPSTAPDPGTGLTVAQRMDGSINLTWTNPTEKDFHYNKIYENSTDSFGTATLIGSTDSDHFIRNVVDNEFGTPIYFWITGVNRSQVEGDESSSVDITPERELKKVFRQNTAPNTANARDGDIWFDTDDDNTVYVFNGTSWVVGGVESLVASRITSGTISSETITLDGSSAIIQSDNYSPGSTGWKIDGNGDAEFNDLILRGNMGVNAANGNFFSTLAGGSPDKGMYGVQSKSLNEAISDLFSNSGPWYSSAITFYGGTGSSGSATISNRLAGQVRGHFTVSIIPLVSAGGYIYLTAALERRLGSGSWSTLATPAGTSLYGGHSAQLLVDTYKTSSYSLVFSYADQLTWLTDATADVQFRVKLTQSSKSTSSASHSWAVACSLGIMIGNI